MFPPSKFGRIVYLRSSRESEAEHKIDIIAGVQLYNCSYLGVIN